jgi:hypothetical protein
MCAGGILRAIKGRTVSSKAIYANAVSERSLAEHKIPSRIGIKVGHCNAQQRKGVVGEAFSKYPEKIGCKQLSLAGRWISSTPNAFLRHIEWGKRSDLDGEKRCRETNEFVEPWAVRFREAADGLKIKFSLLGIGAIRARKHEFVERLTSFRMIG